MSDIIYLDNQATTRCDPRVLDKMLPYFGEHYGNAASTTHAFGWTAEAAVTVAREQVADAVGGQTSEVIFCSGATEANNLAIRGAALAYRERGQHIVLAATEHVSVLDCARRLEAEGWRMSLVEVAPDGLIDKAALAAALTPETTLVSVMLVNNEIGVIQDIAALSAVVHSYSPEILFHCDAAQALGKLPIDVKALGVDLLSVSAHKAYGPKGIGALWRRRRPRLVLEPQVSGGGHEQGLRSGTLPVPLIVGFGEASRLGMQEGVDDERRLGWLRDRLLAALCDELGGIEVNGCMLARIGGNLNIAVEGVPADRLITRLRGVAISSGSACSSAEARPSHVLAAIVDPDRASRSLRIGLGRFTSEAQIERATSLIVDAVRAERG